MNFFEILLLSLIGCGSVWRGCLFSLVKDY